MSKVVECLNTLGDPKKQIRLGQSWLCGSKKNDNKAFVLLCVGKDNDSGQHVAIRLEFLNLKSLCKTICEGIEVRRNKSRKYIRLFLDILNPAWRHN